jgi:hypothetical protein
MKVGSSMANSPIPALFLGLSWPSVFLWLYLQRLLLPWSTHITFHWKITGKEQEPIPKIWIATVTHCYHTLIGELKVILGVGHSTDLIHLWDFLCNPALQLLDELLVFLLPR